MHVYWKSIKGCVLVGANTTAMKEVSPSVLERYLVSHPDVNIELRERLSYQVVKAVMEGAADIGITAQDSGGAGVEFLPYRSDRLILVTHVDHPLAEWESHSFEIGRAHV